MVLVYFVVIEITIFGKVKMLTNLNPFVRFVREVCKDSDDLKPIIAHDCRLFYVKSGSGSVNIHGTEYDLVSGALVFVPPYIKYMFSVGGMTKNREMTLQILNFDLTGERADASIDFAPVEYDSWNGVRMDDAGVPMQFSLPIITSDPSLFGEEIGRIFELFFLSEPYYREFASAYVKAMLLRLISRKRTEGKESSALQILEYIRKNYRSDTLTAELSRNFSYHPNHINRLVKTETGVSLKGYIISYRIKIAKGLLASTDESIADVAWESGFSSPSYFAEQFLRAEGVTPREYRKIIRASLI